MYSQYKLTVRNLKIVVGLILNVLEGKRLWIKIYKGSQVLEPFYLKSILVNDKTCGDSAPVKVHLDPKPCIRITYKGGAGHFHVGKLVLIEDNVGCPTRVTFIEIIEGCLITTVFEVIETQ